MKLGFTIALLLAIPSLGLADTLSYWNVKWNDSTLATFNELNESKLLAIPWKEITEDDSIELEYFSDVIWIDARQVLFVRDEKNRKLRITKTNSTDNKLLFNLKHLLQLAEQNQSKRLDFYHWTESQDEERSAMQLVFQLNLPSD